MTLFDLLHGWTEGCFLCMQHFLGPFSEVLRRESQHGIRRADFSMPAASPELLQVRRFFNTLFWTKRKGCTKAAAIVPGCNDGIFWCNGCDPFVSAGTNTLLLQRRGIQRNGCDPFVSASSLMLLYVRRELRTIRDRDSTTFTSTFTQLLLRDLNAGG